MTDATINGPTVPNDGNLSWYQKSGFAIGDSGINLYWQAVSLFLLFFYTDVLEISPVKAGFVFMVASIWDGITDPVMGYIAERTRTRWGRYRPYLLIGVIPLALAFMAMYYKPALDTSAMVIYALVAHMIFRTCYTVVSIPYSALSARMTQNSKERSDMAGLRMLCATAAGMTVALFTQPLVEKFGEGDAAKGFFYVAVLSALAASVILVACYKSTSEPEELDEQEPMPTMAQVWTQIKQNRPFFVILFSGLVGIFGFTIFGNNILYYFKYFLYAEDAGNIALGAMTMANFLGIPFWMYMTTRIGKRNVWLAGSCFWLITLVCFYFDPYRTVETTVTLIALGGFGISAIGLTFWSMIPDSVEYGEWKTGVRVEAILFGFAQFIIKAAVGIAAGVLGLLLDGIGYQANVVQSAETLYGLVSMMFFVPLLGGIGASAIIFFYPLDFETHGKIVKEIAERKNTGAIS
jgi:GPH family glycoside/pentoside/hexuronide:cation symporter